ncbi:helicase-related protein [Kitasatospora sp. NPDC096147]|uniref:helicase-related protein n=1 Tax=Kitasatospora sp. NPDC096147 TaxID=3364093 RepID=UPI003816553B
MTTQASGIAQDGTPRFAVGTLVHARGREWVVLPESGPDLLVLRPLGGSGDDVAGVLPALEEVRSASFPPPDPTDLGNQSAAGLLRSALRIGFHSSAGPFRSLASLAVEPRPYQLVPLLMALRQETVRLLIADDVGIGKTVEAGLIAAELLKQGEARGLVVLCSPALAEQWRRELRGKFGIDAELVLASTVGRLERGLKLGESVFRPDRNYIVSTDFIKSPRHRGEFVDNCPDLVIVDEAHTCVAETALGAGGSGKRQRQQRFELLQQLAKDDSRHLLLVTATPHSGKEEPFRNLLGLLDPKLAMVSLETDAGRRELAKFLVQRRRGDIREYLGEGTPFPSDRLSSEAAYSLAPDYRRLVDRVIRYARETVRDSDGTLQQRVRWWSALALLRSLASSPAAAAQTLRTRAANAAATSPEEADEIGRAAVLDLADDEAVEAADAVPGALLSSAEAGEEGADDDTGALDADGTEKSARRRLLAMAREAEQLAGPKDSKLAKLTTVVRELLAEGYNPIVFCRFIPTADYVAEHLRTALQPKRAKRGAAQDPPVAVAAVTGTLSPDQRIVRIQELTEQGEEGEPAARQRVLVATDCLSEGVNLQDSFDAVIHYDLAWNPTRHEQREGRVDRFGQLTDKVRVVTLYGTDNRIDGIVLDVLLRKYQQIRRATGVSVPVPDESNNVMAAVLEGLLLRGEEADQLTLELDFGTTQQRDDLHRQWQSAAEREKASRSIYAQNAIKEAEVAVEVAEVRAALGTGTEIRDFVRSALTALRGEVGPMPTATAGLSGATRETADGFTVSTGGLPYGLRDALDAALGARHPEPVVFHDAPTAPRGEAALSRTDPAVTALARFVLDAALDQRLPAAQRPARRCGVILTKAVEKPTTLLLVRYRFQLAIPMRDRRVRHQIAEDARLLAFRGSAAAPEWLTEEEARELLAVRADANIPLEFAARTAERAVSSVELLAPALAERGALFAEQLRESHYRVRGAARAGLAGLKVTTQDRADVLGVYVYRPVAATADATTENGSSNR